MKGKKIFSIFSLSVLFFTVFSFAGYAQNEKPKITEEEKLLQSLHSISSHLLYDYVKELASDKYGGRLTGTDEYKAAAQWVASHFQKWGFSPAGDKGSYFQEFPIPYTLVFKGCGVSLNLPYRDSVIKKQYRYEEEFIPGSTSGSGEVTAEVIYVGYGITAPELNYDDYRGVDVKGKIVLMEREVPISPDQNAEVFKKWRPYSFHQYKLENAVAHGVKGMIYNYGPIANPNNSYNESFIYSHVGEAVVSDIFLGSGRDHEETLGKIQKTLKPQSFSSGKIMTLKNLTEHHPEGKGWNVIGRLEGSDPALKDEVIILGGHLDHLGRCYEIMPGANDNASAIAVILGVAEAVVKCPIKPRRSVVFLCFGAEEQGVVGSEYYLDHPPVPLEKTLAFINLDSVGCGDKLNASAAKNFPQFWEFLDKSNKNYIHRIINPTDFANIARPRLDAARFLWKGVPSISFSSYGATSYYHITKDNMETITPEILEDLAQLLFLTIVDMGSQDSLNFR